MLNQPAPTPYLAHDDKDYNEDNEPKGQMQSIAATVVMAIVYGVRMARYNLLNACQMLACKITKWTNNATNIYSG